MHVGIRNQYHDFEEFALIFRKYSIDSTKDTRFCFCFRNIIVYPPCTRSLRSNDIRTHIEFSPFFFKLNCEVQIRLKSVIR